MSPSDHPARRNQILPPRSSNLRTAASHASIRESNLALVASELFAAGGGLSRADLSIRTGLTRATVSRLVRELMDLGLLTEAQRAEDGKAGRPATPLFPVPGTMVGIGLEVNADRISGTAIDLTGQAVDGFAVEADLVDSDADEVLGRLAEQASRLLKRLRRAGVREVVACYLGVPGLVDAAPNRVAYAPNLGWRDVFPARYLEGALGEGIPFQVDNDANLQAIAAASARSVDPAWPLSFLYLTGDIGIGGAVLDQGAVLRGPRGYAGEIGHTTIEANGPVCHCGSRGCLERYAGKRAILKAAGLPPDAGGEKLLGVLRGGDPRALEAVQRAGWALGIAIANVVNLLDIDHVVLGTSLAPLLPWLTPAMVTELDRRIIGRTSRDVTVLPAPTDPRPTSRGGALLALQEIFSSRLLSAP